MDDHAPPLSRPAAAPLALARPAPGDKRILIFGASGSGTSTLGRHLATALGSQHFDADDLYWVPTNPPFREKRAPEARLALAHALFLPRPAWILSGAIDSWSEGIVPHLTHAVFLTLSQPERRARLEARERKRHGAAMDPGGPAHAETRAFLAWADGYEAGRRPGRSLARHEAFLAGLPCPVLRLDSGPPIEALMAQILDMLAPSSVPV